MTRAELLEKLRELKPWLEEQGIVNLRLFGSYARDEAGPDSDVDLLVEFIPGEAPSGFALVDMQDELSAAFDGRKIDLAFPSILRNSYRRMAIEPQLRPVFE